MYKAQRLVRRMTCGRDWAELRFAPAVDGDSFDEWSVWVGIGCDEYLEDVGMNRICALVEYERFALGLKRDRAEMAA